MKDARQKLAMVGHYVEDSSHKMPRKFLSEEVYAQAIESFVIVCTDSILINRHNRTVYLTKRRVKPMQGSWVIGGRMFAGETPKESMQRCFKRETSLELPADRFSFVCLNEYLWKNRQQEPQNVGSDNLSYTFSVELEPDELAIVSAHLDPNEYELVGLEEFNLERLVAENVHLAIIDLYKLIFPS